MSAEVTRYACGACGHIQRSNRLACGLCGRASSLHALEPTPSKRPLAVSLTHHESMAVLCASQSPLASMVSSLVTETHRQHQSASGGGLGAEGPQISSSLPAADAAPLDVPLEELARELPYPHPGGGSVPGPESDYEFVTLDDDVLEEVVERRLVRWGNVDAMYGGGVPLERVIVVGGPRGIGKSTATMGVAGRMGGVVLAVSTENQSPGEMKTMARQTGIVDTSHIKVLAPRGPFTLKMLCHAAISMPEPPIAIVVDSVQAMQPADPELRSKEAIDTERNVVGLELAQALGCSLFYISQGNKEGQNSGTAKLEYLAQTVLRFRVDEEDPSLLIAQPDGKNRFGPTRIAAHFRFDGQNLRALQRGLDR